MKPITGACLMILGVGLLGLNIYNVLHGMPPAAFGFGAGAASLFVGFMWVQGKSVNRPG